MNAGLSELLKTVNKPELILQYFENAPFDELLEINLKTLEFKSLFHVSKKYTMPLLQGNYKELFISMSEDLIHPDEREDFVELMNPDTLAYRLDCAEIRGLYGAEFRFRLVGGNWRWVELVLLTGEANGLSDHIVRMYIFDCHSRKSRELGLTDTVFYTDHNRNEKTGLLRKRAFLVDAERFIKDSEIKWCLVSIDIENFKLFNEWYGHSEGDLLMVQIGAALLQRNERIGGTAGYFGQDDFCVLIPYDLQQISDLYEEISSLLGTRGSSVGFLPAFGISIVEEGCEILDLIDRSFLACRVAKEGYHSRIRIFDKSMYVHTDEEYHVLSDFLQAIRQNEISFYLQPQCRISSGKVVGAEALARWIRPDGTVVPPDMFIPVLEKRGLISDLDMYIWEKVCAWQRRWIDGGHTPLPISVNVSVSDILHTDLPDVFENLVGKYGIERDLIKIEITESSYISNTVLVRNTVRSLREKGFTVLMDDFGSGYSTLNMLKNLSVDIIKLDAQFLNIDEGNEEKSIRILESVANMAQMIGVPIIVEGVETKEQRDFLRDLGCRYIQGYYYYRPMPTEDYERLIGNCENIDTSGISFKSNQQFRLRELLDNNVYSDTMLNNILGPCAFYQWHCDNDEVDIVRYNEQFYEAVDVPDFSDRLTCIQRFMPKADLPRILDLLREACDDKLNGAKGFLHFYKTDGTLTTFDMHFYYLRSDTDSKLFYGSVRNNTKLSTLERQMNLLSRFSSDTVVFLSREPDGKVQFTVLFNGLSKELGLSAQELETELNNKNFLERVGTEDSMEMHRRLMSKIQNAEPFTEQLKLKDPSGGVFALNLHGNYLPDDAHTMDYIVIMSK